ncbi:hypothetical protein F0562_007723 [Nyssa sinensis]|uniref:RING-type E3 ubiquitin transferase n=1 Tax=Nyssa sinensis TaxID=561372 RepID=A0A5J5A764_9ASTE|nr:hypothetical protein F0562_007723 [Nyssa sinensis]
MNTRECSQGFCSLYCPQWCYIIFPPPPFPFPDHNSGSNLSPLVIGIISILASAFLLVSYYAIISKYCGNMDSTRRRQNDDPIEELEENQDPSNDEPSRDATTGLDESLIKLITVLKYKKQDGLIEVTDCLVCLGEFQEDESLKLLPKCSHAFHVTCIDTWLKSHSNCPLCRANIVFVHASPSRSPPPVIEPLNNESLSENHHENNNDNVAVAEEEISRRDTIIEIRDEEDGQIRRSVSMDYSCQSRVSIADVLQMNQDDNCQMEDCRFHGNLGSFKRSIGEMSVFAKEVIRTNGILK